MTQVSEKRHWQAAIELGFQHLDAKTRLIVNKHVGPLRVLKPFYPEKNDTAHIYLLHPPGGLVVGDELNIGINLHAASSVLVTAPSAGKVYGTGGSTTQQKQAITIHCENGAQCEWLPQETIVFEGANAVLQNEVNLAGNATYFGWELICLGRQAAQEQFLNGSITTTFTLSRDNKLLLRDRMMLTGSDVQRDAMIGFQSKPVYGQLFATGDYSAHIDDWRESMVKWNVNSAHIAISQIRPEVFSARYLGHSSEQGRQFFTQLWQWIRPLQSGRNVVIPRIWNT